MDAPPYQPALLAPRAVPAIHAFTWFESALRMFKRAPGRWCLLGAITLVSQLLLEWLPGIGIAASNVIVPVIECGMLLGAAALDRGAPLEIRFAAAAFRAPVSALAAIVLSSLLVSAVDSLVAYALFGVNLLVDRTDVDLDLWAVLTLGGAAILASLPFVFIPMAVLLERATFGRAFATSARAFSLNIAPLLLYAVLSLGLLVIGILTYGVGLIAVFPLLTTASYAAWKDIFAAPAS
jgi:uncharacterized membrane protein